MLDATLRHRLLRCLGYRHILLHTRHMRRLGDIVRMLGSLVHQRGSGDGLEGSRRLSDRVDSGRHDGADADRIHASVDPV
jgi:hypothetical protein